MCFHLLPCVIQDVHGELSIPKCLKDTLGPSWELHGLVIREQCTKLHSSE